LSSVDEQIRGIGRGLVRGRAKEESMKHRLLILFCTGALIAMAGCSDSSMSGSSGQVTVLLTDAPLDLSTVDAVNVTLNEILLFEREEDQADDEGMAMKMPVSGGQGLTINLLDFQNGKTVTIASLEVPPGDYQKIRMDVASAELVFPDPDDPEGEIVEPVFNPSGKVDVPVSFTVSGGEEVDVTLDFDAALSVQVNTTDGNHAYVLRPVITPTGISID
jgi:hypothetical protein